MLRMVDKVGSKFGRGLLGDDADRPTIRSGWALAKKGRHAEWNESEKHGLSMGTDWKELRASEKMMLPISGTSSSAGKNAMMELRLPLGIARKWKPRVTH
jgi:hypothetical protein